MSQRIVKKIKEEVDPSKFEYRDNQEFCQQNHRMWLNDHLTTTTWQSTQSVTRQ